MSETAEETARGTGNAFAALSPNQDWRSLPLFDRSTWTRVRFGDVVQNVNETERDLTGAGLEHFVGLEHLEPGSLHVSSWGDVADGTTFTRRCRPGQVLFGKRRAYQRKVAVAEFDAVVSGDIYVLAPKDGRLIPQLLPFVCLSERFYEHAVGTSAGSLSPRTNWSSLAGFEFDLPPLEVQRRIAEVLWAADDLNKRIQKLQYDSETLKKTKVKEVAESTNSSITLGDVATSITSGSRGWAEFYSADGAIFIRITNLQRDSISFDWSDIQRVSPPSNKEVERTRVQQGDLLISVTAELGLIAVVEELPDEAYVNQHIAKVSVDSSKFDPYLAGLILCHPPYNDQFRKLNDQGAKAGMNLKNVAKLKLPDLSRTRQEEIIRELRSIESISGSLQGIQSSLWELRNSLLQNLIGGR